MLRSTLRAVAIALALSAGPLASIASGDIEVLDENQIYHGDPDYARTAGCISANEVFMAIPAYRKIIDEKIDKSDPRYWLLMEEANRIFRRALRRSERDHGYDLIGELGSILVDGAPAPDITAIAVQCARASAGDQ